MKTQRRVERLKESVIAAFREEKPEISARLSEFTLRDWQKSLFWLDASGLALYLFDRLTSLGLQHSMPPAILARLQQNLTDNRERTDALFAETVKVGRALQQQNISYVVLKGVSLSPDSVPDSALRYQLDLDFLIAHGDAVAAQQILCSLGYRLHAVSGNTLEFTTPGSAEMDLSKLYKASPHKSLELHLLSHEHKGSHTAPQDRLARAEFRRFREWTLPVLSPADLFLQQALHLFKHLCSEHTRASWVLEFWRHVLARRGDTVFWSEVESLAASEVNGYVAIGAVVLLATRMFSECAPAELSRWSVDELPASVRLWIETYGQRALITNFPGSKLYLLLRSHLEPEGGACRQSLRRLVFPRRLPPRITHGEAGERLFARLRRYRIEASFVLLRLRFHLVEGLRYAVESSRWQRRLTGITQ